MEVDKQHIERLEKARRCNLPELAAMYLNDEISGSEYSHISRMRNQQENEDGG